MNILLVEDDVVTAESLKRQLKLLQYNITATVASGEDALKAAEKFPPDIILMDIVLKGRMDGIVTAGIIKKKLDIPVIFLSSASDNLSIERAKFSEPYAYIIKPIQICDLKTTIEISYHKSKMERKVRNSEIWLKTILKSIGEAIITSDGNNIVNFVNERAEALLGREAKECIGKHIFEVYQVTEDSSNEFLMSSLFGNKNYFEQFLKNKLLSTKDKHVIPVEETISEIKNGNGKVLGTLISFKDITSKRQTELFALLSKKHYLTQLENSPALIWRCNTNGEFTYFNKTWLEFTGRSLEQEIGSGFLNGIKKEDQQILVNALKDSLEKKENFQIEFEILNYNNEFRWLLCVANTFKDLHGEFDGFLGMCLEITKRKRMEEELIKAKHAAESASFSKTRFISNMSHELRTPLNALVGLTDILLDTQINNEQSEYLCLIKQSSGNLLLLLNNLLDFAKFESGKERISDVEFELDELVDEVFSLYQFSAKKKRLTLNLRFEENAKMKYRGDKIKIQQILHNLLSNAVKFTDSGFVFLEIFMEEKTAGLNNGKVLIHFVIKDSGIGIPDEKQDYIYETFKQLDGSSTRKYSGAGLGLSITKLIVDLLKGRIWLKSDVGKGTEFHVLLALQKKEDKNCKHENQRGCHEGINS